MAWMRPALWFLAVPLLSSQPAAQALGEEPAGRPLLRVEVTGCSLDDQRYVLAALGLAPGRRPDETALAHSLEAVRLTDRFRRVDARRLDAPGGEVLQVEVEPWPPLTGWHLQGDLPAGLKERAPWSLRKGQRLGERRCEAQRAELEGWLRASGYPAAVVRVERSPDGTKARFLAAPGAPDLIQRIRLEGDPSPYPENQLIALLRMKPGQDVWTEGGRREAVSRIRRRFIKDRRFFGTVELLWTPEGTLTLRVVPGPVVRLAGEGSGFGAHRIVLQGLGWTRLKDLVPLARADRFSPELLDEGARRITRTLRERGYLDVAVSHRTEVTKGTEAAPLEVRVVYRIDRGPRLVLKAVRAIKSEELDSESLREATSLPPSFPPIQTNYATPELLGAMEDRLLHAYRAKGFADARIGRPSLERDGRDVTLVLEVREGVRRTLESVVLDVPDLPGWNPWELADQLPLAAADRPYLESFQGGRRRIYRSDRPAFASHVLTVEELDAPPRPGLRRYRLTADAPLPLVRGDFASVLAGVRQRLTAWGALHPPPEQLRLEEGRTGAIVHIEVPVQPLGAVARLVVQGADATRARAVLRSAPLQPGDPLDPARLAQAQAQVGNLGAFDRVDLFSARELEETPTAWEDGDLVLQLRERSPWVFSSGFGYDKSQGYHLGFGAQRLNLGGMGRTLDFGIRAGDATIRNPTLRRWFPTGAYTRSVDMYSVGYSDPFFAPEVLSGLLPDHAQLLGEAAYIEERRSLYLLRRRRVISGLEWPKGNHWHFQAGYRFERSEVAAAPGVDIRDEDLAVVARIPGRAVISAPYLQVTRDLRDNPLDPTSGSFGALRLEFANQVFGTSSNSSFVKVDARHQWHWPLGRRASHGVVSLSLRAGVARPTASSSQELPLAERFFAGGPGSHRGVEPDALGPRGAIPRLDDAGQPVLDGNGNPLFQYLPLGGQGLVLGSLEYRFPIPFLGSTVWGEVFADSGQVYQSLTDAGQSPRWPPLRTALGLGLIFKIGLPLKVEYAADVKRILGRPRTPAERDTQLKSLLISAGFQF